MVPMPFPVFLDLRGKRCLVIGGGPEADRKAALLRRAGAAVLRSGGFADELLDGVFLLIVASALRSVSEAAARAASERGVLVNVVDQPDLCGFSFAAIVERAPVVVAISTGGAAPALAKLLRVVLDAIVPRRLGDLAALAACFRPLVAGSLPTQDARRRFWERLFRGRVAWMALAGRPAGRALKQALDEAVRAEAGEPAVQR